MAMCIFGASLLGSGLVANILISIRAVLPQDKAIALALELTFIGLLSNIPGKIGYQFIAGSFKTFPYCNRDTDHFFPQIQPVSFGHQAMTILFATCTIQDLECF